MGQVIEVMIGRNATRLTLSRICRSHGSRSSFVLPLDRRELIIERGFSHFLGANGPW
jgi:hypothetical protein